MAYIRVKKRCTFAYIRVHADAWERCMPLWNYMKRAGFLQCVPPTRRTFGAAASGFITVRTCCSSLPTTSRMTSSSHASVPAEPSKLGTHSLVPPPACSEAACHNALRCRGLFGCVCGSKIGRGMARMCNDTSSGHLRSTTKTRTRRGPGGIRGAPGGSRGTRGDDPRGIRGPRRGSSLVEPCVVPRFRPGAR